MCGNIFVFNVDFLGFFGGFGHHLGFSFSFKNRPKFKVLPLGRSKNQQKSFKMLKKLILGRFFDASVFQVGFGEGFGRVLERFLMDFESCGRCC